jgi:RNA polymerase sigma factor (sigma-70 family)
LKSTLSTGVIFTMDPEHLGYLIDRHSAALTLFARQWCAAAEDIVQEALIKLVRQSPPPNQPIAWLYRTVRNGAISQCRAERRRQTHEAHAAERAPLWFEPPNDPGGLDAAAAGKALAELPIEQREAIVAHLWGGLTFEQIAEISGASAATLWRRYTAGLTALRQKLGISCPKAPIT